VDDGSVVWSRFDSGKRRQPRHADAAHFTLIADRSVAQPNGAAHRPEVAAV